MSWKGGRDNFDYASFAPTAPHVFIGDPDFRELWLSDDRYYLLTDHEDLPYLQELVGAPALHIVSESGRKYLLTNHPLPLGEGRVRVSRFGETCDPHPALRAVLSQRERNQRA